MPGTRRRVAVAAAVALTVASLLSAAPAYAISGGAPAPSGAYQFTAKLTVGQRGCSGALIDTQWLLTASSCFAVSPEEGFQIPAGAPRQPSSALVGRTDLGTSTGQSVDIVELVPRGDRDLVLAKLASPVTGIAPVPVTGAAPATGETLEVAGFGRTSSEWVPLNLQHAPFTVGAVTATTVGINGNAPAEASTCRGDSGGPALRESGGRVELVAVNSTSFQGGCFDEAGTRRGATEARADNVGDWIRQTVPNLAIDCAPSAPIFLTRDNGTLWRYEHADPRNGGFTWINPDGQEVGSGWLGARAVSSVDGVLYQANSNGQLRRFRWNGNGWDLNNSPTPYYEHLDWGWDRYAGAEYRNRITVDADGYIYTIEPDGNLHWRSYDYASKTWQHRVVAGNWGKYNLIVAAGKGVLYARTTSGDLYRHTYDVATNTLVESTTLAGTGWGPFKSIMSVGADTLYGTYPAEDGGLLWYRFLPASNTWYPSGRDNGKLIGTGWYSLYDMTAAPNSCTLVQ